MAVAGAGGFLSNLFFPDLDKNLARQMTPNPNPLAQQGPGPQNPKAVDSLGNPVPVQAPQPSLAPAAVTQPDPVNASYNENLIAASRRDKMAEGLNQGFGEIAAGFGTAQQQASKQANLRQGGVGNSLADLVSIQAMQDQTIKDNEHARFMGNAAVFAQTLRNQGINVTDAQATEIMNNPELLQQIGGAAAGNATLTGTTKDANTATEAWARANPNATKQQIDDYRANLIAGGMGGSDLDQREYLAAHSAGTFAGTFADWKAKHAAEAAAGVDQAKAVVDFKNTGTTDFVSVDDKLTRNEKTVDSLLKNVDATRAALSKPEMFTSGKVAANTPDWLAGWEGATPEVKTAALQIKTLLNELSASGLKDTKNVRNQKEFNALAGALTSALDPNNPDLRGALEEIKSKFASAHAQAYAAAGKKIPYQYNGLANPDMLDPKSPWYTGASYEDPPKEDSGPAPTPTPTIKRRHYNEKGELVD